MTRFWTFGEKSLSDIHQEIKGSAVNYEAVTVLRVAAMFQYVKKRADGLEDILGHIQFPMFAKLDQIVTAEKFDSLLKAFAEPVTLGTLEKIQPLVEKLHSSPNQKIDAILNGVHHVATTGVVNQLHPVLEKLQPPLSEILDALLGRIAHES